MESEKVVSCDCLDNIITVIEKRYTLEFAVVRERKKREGYIDPYESSYLTLEQLGEEMKKSLQKAIHCGMIGEGFSGRARGRKLIDLVDAVVRDPVDNYPLDMFADAMSDAVRTVRPCYTPPVR